MRLITWQMALDHLKESDPGGSPALNPSREADLRLKIDIAEALVLDYVDQRIGTVASAAWSAEVAAWDIEAPASPPVTVPPQVQAAVLIQLKELDRFRGDDIDSDSPERPPAMLHPLVVAYLHRLRDPAIA